MRPRLGVLALLTVCACGHADTRVVPPATVAVGAVGCDAPGTPLAEALALARDGALRAAERAARAAPATCATGRDAFVAGVRAELDGAAPTVAAAEAEIASADAARERGDEAGARRAFERAWSALARADGKPPEPVEQSSDVSPALSPGGRWLRVGDAAIEIATGRAYAGSPTFLDGAESRALFTKPGVEDDDPVAVRVVDLASGRSVLDVLAAHEPKVVAHGTTLLYESRDNPALAFASTTTGATIVVPAGGELVRRVFHGETDADDQDVLAIDDRTFAWVTEGDVLHVRSLDEPSERTFGSGGAKITAIAIANDRVALAWDDAKVRVHRLDGAVTLAVDGVAAEAVAPRRDGAAVAYSDGAELHVVDARGKHLRMPLDASGFGAPRALDFGKGTTVYGFQQSGDIWCTESYDLVRKKAAMVSVVTPGTDYEQGNDDTALCKKAHGEGCETEGGFGFLPRSGHEALVRVKDGVAIVDEKTAKVLVRYGAEVGCGEGRASFDARNVVCSGSDGDLHVIARSTGRVILATSLDHLGCRSGLLLYPAALCAP